MTRTADDPFLVFEDESMDWWDEPEEVRPSPQPDSVHAPERVRRPPARTFARDLARLRTRLARRGPLVPVVAVLGLVALVTIAVALRIASAGADGSDPAAEPSAAATPAPAPEPTRAPAAPTPAPAAARLLRPGDSGADVRDLQQALAALGYYTSTADGAFGDGTAAAVGAFQGAGGLLTDGIVGATTTAALREAVAARAQIDAGSANEGLAAAAESGRLTAEAAEQHGETLAAALDALRELPPGRGATIAAVLGDVAVHADAYDRPRALALFGMLEANVRHLRRNPAPAQPGDIEGADGVVYRYFRGPGYKFHPLANFSHLNALAHRNEREKAAKLAEALVARGIPVGNALSWEYFFPFGGPPRWTSGFAQAVGARALARAADLLDDPALERSARRAYRMVPRLSRPLASGTWVREYGFSDSAILNAQLQSIVSLLKYVELTGDVAAQRFTERMLAATRDLIGQFDTGCWSLYSLGGGIASPSYHAYHVTLLRQLAALTQEPLWRETGTRWNDYQLHGSSAAC